MTTQRLPIPGQDDGTWGDILNGFLGVEHNGDGTLKVRSDGTFATLSSGKVPSGQLGSGTASNSNYLRGDGTWSVPSGSGSANATVSSPGLVQLAGDLGGSGTSATAPVISDGAVTNSKLANGVISTNKLAAGAVTSNEIADGTITNTDISSSAAIARTKLDSSTQTSLGKADTALQSAPVTSVAGRGGDVVLAESDIANLSNDLAAKADSSSLATVATSGSYTDLSNKPTVPTMAANTYTGIQTAPAFAVSGLAGATQPSRYVGGSSGSPSTGTFAVGDFVIDVTGSIYVCSVAGSPGSWVAFGARSNTTPQPLGTAAAGNALDVSRSNHIHAMPRLDQVLAPTAAVALNSQKITGLANGTVATDAATYGQLSAAASQNVVTKSSAYTASAGDFVLASATSGAVTITSPAASANISVSVKKTDSSTNAVTFTPASGTVDGAASFALTNQYDSYRFICDSTNWWVF